MRITEVLPESLDNRFRGRVGALWLFVPVLIVKTGIALGTIFNGRAAAQSADGIPLDRFGADGAQAVVALFAIWGLAQLVLCGLGVLALVRYRAMVPLLFLLLLLEQLARKGILMVQPIPRAGTAPGGAINLALLAIMAVGVALSLWSREFPGKPSSP